MRCSLSLEKRVIEKVYRYRNLQKYHAVFVGAEYQQYHAYSANKSYLSKKDLIKLDSRLLHKLFQIGTPGTKENGNYLGNCAEVHAGDKVLGQCHSMTVDQLCFSHAYRPRTLQIVPYCKNCILTFNL